MIEIELFYKIVESEIRRKHIKYLKKQKCLPSDQLKEEAVSDETVSTVSAADEFVYLDKPKNKEKVKRVKAFNNGIETALNVLIAKYKAFAKRLEKEAKEGKKF